MSRRNPIAHAVRRLRPQAVPDKRAELETRLALAELKLDLLDSLTEIDCTPIVSSGEWDEE